MVSLFAELYNSHKKELSANELALLVALARCEHQIPSSSLSELSNKCYVSSSTLYRLIRKLGFEGFPAFKYRVGDSLAAIKIKNGNVCIPLAGLVECTTQRIHETYLINQSQLSRAARMILAADTRYLFGTGSKQKQAISNFSDDLLVYGEKSIRVRNEYDLATAVPNMNKKDILVIASLSGAMRGYETSVDELLSKKIPIISVTADIPNPLSRESGVALFFAERENKKYNRHWAAFSMDFVFELLIHSIMNERSAFFDGHGY